MGKKPQRKKGASAKSSSMSSSYKPLIATEESDDPEALAAKAFNTRAEILAWFQTCSEIDAAWVLERLAESSAHLIYAAISDQIEAAIDRRKDEEKIAAAVAEKEKERKRRQMQRNTGIIPGDPIIQFSSSVFYAEEGVDKIMMLDVMRIGNQEGVSEVYYETKDDSATAGRAYEAVSGRLVFKPGVALLHIAIPIINNDLWDTTAEFKCQLSKDDVKGAVLGQYLWHTRVKIIDNNYFPTDRFSHLTTKEKIAAAPKWSLLLGYCTLIMHIPGVKLATVKYMLIDVLKNIWYLFNLFMTVYIVDYIVKASRPESALLMIHDKVGSLQLAALITVGKVGIFHFFDIKRLGFGMSGKPRNFIQNALLRKFLNYKRTVRETLLIGDVIMGMDRDAAELVKDGYQNILKMTGLFGKMVCMVIFKLASPYVFGGKKDYLIFLPMLCFPIALYIFLRCREDVTFHALDHRNEMQAMVASEVAVITRNCSLVVDYGLQNHCEHKFQKKQKEFSTASNTASYIVMNNMYFCKWCQEALTAIWILYGGVQVIKGQASIGIFITTLRLFDQLGDSFSDIYECAVQTMNAFPALDNVTNLMNLSTDTVQCSRMKRSQLEEAKRKRISLEQSMTISGAKGVPIDVMPIVLNFTYPFKYSTQGGSLNFKGRVQLHQGQLVAVVGPLGAGKATLLRLFAGTVMPEEDREPPVFVPSHLRIANVADEPLFFSGTLYENLVFGMEPDTQDASLERVRSICQLLTRSHAISDKLDSAVEQDWASVFSGAQCKLLSIARALIQNYELLCIHKPLAKLTHDDAEHVVQALHEHVDSKGLKLASDGAKRRPRTIILSAASDRAVRESNNVVVVDPIKGVRVLLQDETQLIEMDK